MKNLKISLTVILTAIVLAISTGVYAYTGSVDTTYEITMPNSLTNGEGTVKTLLSGEMKYQFVEISQEKYATIKKYGDQVELIQAYQKGEFANWESSQANEEYKAMVNKYESTYNEKVSDVYQKYESFNSNGLSDARSLWIHELPDPTDNWQAATDKKISIDLTTFTGTKYYVGWLKVGDVLDAEAYIATGTKKNEDPKQEDPKNEDPKQEDPKNNNTVVNNTINNNVKGNGTVSNKQDTTASTEGKILPKTGVSSIALGLIAIAGTSAGISYRKYRKIK